MARTSFMRGPLSCQRVEAVAPVAGPIQHIPTLSTRRRRRHPLVAVGSLAGRVAWRYRVELALVAGPLVLWALLTRLLPDLAALVVFVVVVVAVGWWQRRSGAVWRWLRAAWFRRMWDRACRLAHLHNLDERTPSVRGLTFGAVGERFTSVVPPGRAFADLDSARDRLAAYLHVRCPGRGGR